MQVKIITDLSGELQFDMSAENYIQLIGAATRYVADNSESVVTTHYADGEVVGQEVERIPEKSVSKVERMFGDYRSRIPVSAVIPEVKKADEGYKGFLLIRCEECGDLRGFYAKNPTTHYFCKKCDHKTPLDQLIPAHLNCKCGSRFRYLTNYPDEYLTYNCLDCGAPVDLELNKNGNAYVTVGYRR